MNTQTGRLTPVPPVVPLERDVQRAIEDALGCLPDLTLLRNSVGSAKHINEGDGRIFYVPYGLGGGSPDLVGFLAPWGHVVGLEVKRPGEDPTEVQERCHRAWRRAGATVEVVRSVADARTAIDKARRACGELARLWVMREEATTAARKPKAKSGERTR